jgi:hypothetical protein
MPQLGQIEKKLKDDGFTIPDRPVRRLQQGPPGQVNKIVLNDFEVIKLVMAAMQAAMDHHIKSFVAAVREDIAEMFSDFLSSTRRWLPPRRADKLQNTKLARTPSNVPLPLLKLLIQSPKTILNREVDLTRQDAILGTKKQQARRYDRASHITLLICAVSTCRTSIFASMR